MRKIGFIINYPLQNQIDTGTLDVLKVSFENALNSFGEVHVFSTKDNHPPEHYQLGDKIKVHTIPRRFPSVFGVFDEYLRIKKIVQQENLSLLRAFIPLSAGLISVRIGKALRIPVIVSIHGDRVQTERLQGMNRFEAIKNWLRSYVLRNANVVPVITEDMKQYALRFGVPKDKIVKHPNFVDTNKFQPPAFVKDYGLIMYVGRLSKEKKLDVFIKAIKKVKNKLRVRYQIIGEGPERENLERLVKELHLEKNVFFNGKISHEDLPTHYHANSLFLGGGGFSVIEAQSCGLPVITYKLEGAKDLILKNKTGFLCDLDPTLIAEKVRLLLTNTELRNKMSRTARKWAVKKFSLESFKKREQDFYRRFT